MANPLVVDLSHHNPTPDWVQLKAAGTVGIIHKATEGTTFVDSELFERAREAEDAGLCWSTYHFLRKGKVKSQISHYLGTINPKYGERVCIDHESAPDGSTPSLSELKQAVQGILEQRPDLQITIYSGNLIKEQLGYTADGLLAATTSLWIAHYTSNSAPEWPRGTWPTWSLWQYTDKATVVGISAPVDGDRWNGDPARLVQWFGPAVEEPLPIPGEGKEVLVAITQPEGVNVVVTVNGQPYGPAAIV